MSATALQTPAVLRGARPSVRSVYAILASADGALKPRGIVAEWERLSGDFASVDTVNHALAALKRLGLARSSPAGWVVQAPALPPVEVVYMPARFLLVR